MGHATACMDLPCEQAQFLYTCAERGLEDSALILIATWYRQGPAMTQHFNVNHGHPDGDLLTSILAYEWFLECQKSYGTKYGDWKTSATLEWKACSRVGLIHHILVAIHESVLVLKQTFDEHRHASREVPKRKLGYSTLLLNSVWTSFFDRSLIKLPTGEYVSPQYGGSWTLESSSLCHHPTVIIALNRTIRDGASYVSCLAPIPDEWLVEKDWFIVNHWEDQFCRDVYQDLCVFAEFQHLHATALISPGTTPLVCPVDSLVNTHPSPLLGTDVTMATLDPCAWRYVLTQDDLAIFQLQIRSDVAGAWEIASTTYNYFYCQVKIRVSAQCFTSTASKSGKTHCGEQSDKTDSVPVMHTRVLLLPLELTKLTQPAAIRLKRDAAPPAGAVKACRESQSRI